VGVENFQDYYSYCGNLIISVITIVEIFQIDLSKLEIKLSSGSSESFIIDYLNNFYYRMCDNLVNTEPTNCDNDDRIIIDNYNNLMIDWVNALFDDRNEGLSDELIKSLNIKQIYKIIPIIYRQGIIDTNNKKINWEILNNGLEYLSQPFLTPIIPIIIKSLLRDFTIDNDLKFKIIRELIKDNNNNNNDERITTSQQLEKLNEKIHRHECLLNEFRKIRTNTTETNLFAKSIRLLNDKLIEKITNWII
ncbi:hypothetical protein MEU_05849, partial [Candida albicans P37005]